MEHTPTPWQIDSSASGLSIESVSHGHVALVNLARASKEDAAFIVRACNAHDQLVAALQEIVSTDAITAHKIARAALAKVQA